MLIYTGLRIGELFNMRAKDVHDEYCIGGSKTETGKNRIVPIPSEIRGFFKYFLSIAESGGLLLSGYCGNLNLNSFRRHDYYPLLESLKITKKSPHSTRHTYASMAVRSGIKPELLQKILGL
jgi:integrase